MTIPKSSGDPCFYRFLGPWEAESGLAGERFASLPTTAGPWSPDAQHGGPPAALLGRAVEGLGAGEVGRFTMELLGPVPVADVAVTAVVVRRGRSVSLATASLWDVATGRAVASASAWLFPAGSGPASPGPPPAHGPEDGVTRATPSGWNPGYLDAVEWRWVSGGLDETGAGVVWMRPPALLADEPLSPLQRLLACADSASGVSARLDIRAWAFVNTELTVHVVRPIVGEWVCLEAVTLLGPGSVGVATSTAYDGLGPVARTAQALLVRPR